MYNDVHVIEMARTSTVAFMKSKIFLVIRCKEKRVIWTFFKALANRFRLISKSIRHVKEQRSCL